MRRIKQILLFGVLALYAAGCGGGGSDSSPGFKDDGGNFYQPDEGPIEVVYGTDSRGEACAGCDGSIAHPNEELQSIAEGVAMLVRPQALVIDQGAGSLVGFSLKERIEIVYGAPLCSGERFAAQPAPGFCSGFLVGDRQVATARHCIPDQDACDNTLFVFGYQMGASGQPGALDLESDVYQCVDINVAVEDESGRFDIAIITLDRPVDRNGLIVAAVAADLEIGTRLAVIGHPSGLPQKIADDGEALSFDAERNYFVASLDTFAGSSGSPVISLENLEVVGMLVGGEQDYFLTDRGCYGVKVCPEDAGECSGELVLGITEDIFQSQED